MRGLGLLNSDFKKSQKINGAVMSIHEHGDSSIYEAMGLMTTSYDGMNVPFVVGKGSFGKKYSRDLKCAAPRYTNVKLAPICKEIFEGIQENAVDFVDNYDSTEKEPTMLPVKFPNILVNSSGGVAVGTSSNIPCFSLVNVCKATQGVLNGSIKAPADLAEVLGAPEFTTGGFLHSSKESLTNLCATGKGSFVISGKVEVYDSRIVITEIPYTTTAEDIMDEIEKAIKEKKLKGVSEVNDEIGLEGLRLVVQIKKGYNSREILRELCLLTTLRTSISYRTRLIISDRCKEVNLLELLTYWILFREECVRRVYAYRREKYVTDETLYSTWEKIIHDIPGVVNMISKNTESVAKQNLMKTYGLQEVQAEYLLDMKIRLITIDRAKKELEKLAQVRADLKYCDAILSGEDEIRKLIYRELQEIIDKYGKNNRTTKVDELTEEDTKRAEVKISDERVTVVYTKGGFVRRLTSMNDLMNKFVSKTGDEEVLRWSLRNNEFILVFDRFGTIHKVLADSIDSSNRAQMTDELYKIAGLEKAEDMIYADVCGDYTGYFNIVYPNGRGTRVYYSKASGSRSQYKAYYEEVKPGQFWITKEDKFFMITNRMKAAYCDITRLSQISNRAAFKVARVSSGDYFTRLMPYDALPNPALIDLNKYNRGYTVLIGDDCFWIDEGAAERTKKAIREHLDKYKQAEEEENANENTGENVNDENSGTSTESADIII